MAKSTKSSPPRDEPSPGDLDYLRIQTTVPGRIPALMPPPLPRDLVGEDSTPPPISWRVELIAGVDRDPTLPVPHSFLATP